MLKVDFHTHSLASHHALNSIEEILRRADQLGIAGVAITDHGPGTDNAVQIANNQDRPNHWLERIKGPDTHYFKVFLSRYEAPKEIKAKLFRGIECNIYGEGDVIVDLPKSLASDFDVVIASVHPLPYLFELKNETLVAERMILAMDAGIDIIGHPFHKTFALDQELVVRAAAEKGIALELNDSSLRLQKAEEPTIMQMLELAKIHYCRISLSSDAHVANELGSDRCIRSLLQQCNFPEELIVNHSLEAACEFVEERKKIRTERVI
jgi:putative hydrolase